MSKCKNCKYFRSCEGKTRGKCEHPERKDDNLVYYFGGHKETDYCALYVAEGGDNEQREAD